MTTPNLILTLVALAAAAAVSVGLAKAGDLWRSRRDLAGVEAVVWLACAFVLLIGQSVGAALAGRLSGSFSGSTERLQKLAVGQIVAYAVTIAVGALLVVLLDRGLSGPDGAGPLNVRRRSAAGAGLRIGAGDLWRGVLALALIAPFYLVTTGAVTWIQRMIGSAEDPNKHVTLRTLQDALGPGSAAPANERAWAWVVVGCAVIAAPIVEELMFRGFLQSFFVRALNGKGRGEATTSSRGVTLGAVMCTSLVFAAMHVAPGTVPWSAAAPLLVLSMGLGLAFERTGRLGTPIVAHALFNLANVLAVVAGLAGNAG